MACCHPQLQESQQKKKHQQGPEASDQEPQFDEGVTLTQRTKTKEGPLSHAKAQPSRPPTVDLFMKAASCSSSTMRMGKPRKVA